MAKNNVKPEPKESRHLECVLTEDEVKQYGVDLAHRLLDIGALEAEKSKLTAKIKPIQVDVNDLVQKVDSGKEVREVDCEWHFDWERGMKRLIRTDTWEPVPGSETVTTDFDRQMYFDEV